MRKCYIRKYNNSQQYIDLYATYRMVVLESKGINDLPERKEPFTENWADANGIKVIESTTNVFKPIKVKFKFALLGGREVAQAHFKAFWLELVRIIPKVNNPNIGSSIMEYYDTDMTIARAKKIRLVSGASDLEFTEQKVTDVQNPTDLVSAIMFDMEFSIDNPDINSY